MSWGLWIGGGLIVIALYIIYVGLITKKNKVNEAQSGIDVQLKKTL